MESGRPLTPLRIQAALRLAKGNRKRAAQLLGIGRATLYRWLDRLEMDRPGMVGSSGKTTPGAPDLITLADGLELAGRGRELARALELLSPVSRPGSPTAVVMVGDAGTGRTCLLRALTERLSASGIAVARGSCRPGSAAGLSPLAEALHDLLGDGTENRELIRRHAAAVHLVAPRLLVRHAIPVPEDEAGLADRAVMLGSLAQLFADAATGKGLLIVFDDLHLAEPFLLDLFWLLARQGRDLPLRLAAASLPPADWPSINALLAGAAAEGLVAPIALAPLEEASVRLLATRYLKWNEALTAVATTHLLRLTGGNPLHLRLALRRLATGPPRPGEDLEALLPASIPEALHEELDRMPAPAREVLEALAARGAAAGVSELGQVVGQPAAAELGSLLHAGWVVRNPHGRYRIAHSLFRDAVHEATPPETRRRHHGTWAAAMEGDPSRLIERADQLVAAGSGGAEARELFAAAAEWLERTWQHRGAIRLLDAVLAQLPPGDPARLGLYPRLERACHAARERERSLQICRSWATLAFDLSDLGSEARALGLLAVRLREAGEGKGAREAAMRGLECARRLGDASTIALAESILAGILWTTWDHSAALEHMERSLDMLRQGDDPQAYARHLQEIVLPRALAGRGHAAMDAAAEAERLFRDKEENSTSAARSVRAILAMAYMGDLEEAARRLRALVALERGRTSLEPALQALAFVLLRLGRFTEALAVAEELSDEALRTGRQGHRISAFLAQGEALFQLGCHDRARDQNHLALELARTQGEEAQLAFARLGRARDLRVEGHIPEATAEAQWVFEAAERGGRQRLRHAAALELTRCAIGERDWPRARRWLDRAEESLQVPREDGPAQRSAMLLERARVRLAEKQDHLAFSDIEEGLGLVRRAGPAVVEIQLLLLKANLCDIRGDEAGAGEALALAGRRIQDLANHIDDRALQESFLGRSDFQPLVDAARKDGLLELHRFRDMAVRSAPLRQLIERLEKADPKTLPVVIIGSAGEGLTARLLEARDWQGDLRSLETSIRMLLLQAGSRKLAADSPEIKPAKEPTKVPTPRREPGEKQKEAIRRALAATNGDKTRAAKLLGISRATLYRRLEK